MDKKTKVLAGALTGAMAVGVGASAHMGAVNNNNKTVEHTNHILLEQHDAMSTNVGKVGCIVNNTGNLTLHQENGATGYVSVGEMVTIMGHSSLGYKVRVHETGAVGYLNAKDIQIIANSENANLQSINKPGQIINVSSAVNLRQEAMMSNNIMSVLTNSTKVQILGKQGQWFKVEANGVTGFIYEEYVAELSINGVTLPQAVSGNESSVTANTGNTTTVAPMKHNPSKVTSTADVINSHKVVTGKSVTTDNHVSKGTDVAPVPTTHVKVVNHDMQHKTPDKVVNHNVQPSEGTHHNGGTTPVNHNNGTTPVNHSNGTTPVNHSGGTTPVNHSNGTTPVNHSGGTIHNGSTNPNTPSGKTTPVVHHNGTTPVNHNGGDKQPVANPNAGTKIVPSQSGTGKNTPSNPSKYKPVPSGVNGKKGDAVHGHVITPSKPSTGNTGSTTPSNPVNGGGTIHKGSTNPATPDNHNGSKGHISHFTPMHHDGDKGGTIHNGSTNPATPDNHNGSKGHISHFTPMHHDGDKGGTIHNGSTNPATPDNHSGKGTTTPTHHVTPMEAPTLVAHNYKLIIGRTFSNSMLDASANEGATISYEGHVNNMKPGTYPITVIATNSQGGKTEAKVNVDVVDVAPVINAENYTMTQGDSFSNADLHISAHSQAGANLTQDVKVDGSVNTMKPGTYKLTLTVKDQFGATNERTVEVTVNKAANPVFTVNPEVTTPYGVQVLGTELGVNVLGNTNETHDFTISTSGNVDYHKAGTYEITITVTNQFGESSSKQVKIIVQPQKVAPKPVVKPVAPEHHKETPAKHHEVTPAKHHEVTPAKHHKETPKPIVKEAAPVITVSKTFSMMQGKSFAYSELGASANEGARIEYSGQVNVNTPGTYNVVITATNSQGTKTTETVAVTVKAKPEAAPTITASNKSVQQGSNWNNSMVNATSNEGASVTYSGNVNTAKPGVYNVTVTATNAQGTTSTKVVEVTVEAVGAPVISGHNVTINVGHKFNTSMIGASATVNGNPVQVTYTGNVNNEQKGEYSVTVTANNGFGKVASQTYTVTVNDSATLVAHNYSMTVGQSFNLSDLNITATNIDGTNIANSAQIISGSVNTNEAGTYNITIQVNDGHGATATQTVTVTVKAKPVAPVVTASPVTIIAGNQLTNAMFHASSSESNVQWNYNTSNVNINTPGTYNVTITATNAEGLVGTDTVQVTVKAVPLAPAQVSAQNVTLTQGQTLNDSSFNATSNENGTTFSYDTSNVNTNTPGTYNVTITATNTQGKVSSITVQVIVKAKQVVNVFTPTGSNGAGTFTGNITTVNSDWQNVTNHVTGVRAYINNSKAAEQEYTRLLFNDINQFREANGLQAFTWSNDLAYMANWKSNDCSVHDYFTHKDLQGQYTNQVFSNQIHFGSWCENLAGGASMSGNIKAGNETIITQSQLVSTANSIFQAWKASPGHRANMLSNNKFGAVSLTGGIATMEAGSPTEGAFNPITGTFTKSQFPDSLQNPGPNVFTVIVPKNK